MSYDDSILELRVYCKAGFSAVALVTHESDRVQREVKFWADHDDRVVVTWNCMSGFVYDGVVNGTEGSDIKDPLEALTAIAAWPTDPNRRGYVFLMEDFHLFMDEDSPDPQIVSEFRSVGEICRRTSRMIVLVGCRAAIPPELEKEIVVLDWNLPDREYIRNQILKFAEQGQGIDLQEKDLPVLVESAQGMTDREVEDAFALSIVRNGKRRLDREGAVSVRDQKKQIIKKSGLLDYYPKGTEQMSEIGGLDLLKDWLERRRRAFSDIQEAADFGLPSPKGILMVGVPGCGKSLVAKAVASCWDVSLLRFDPGKAFGSLVGQSEERIRSVCKQAAAMAPCVLWVDEVEKGMAGMGSSGMTDSGVTARVFGTFLTWMQENTAPVFVIATANSVSTLPPELVRRFTEVWAVDLPTDDERREIWRIQIQKARLSHGGRDPEGFDLNELMMRSTGLSGAEIEKAYLDGLMVSFEEGREPTTEDFVNACQVITPISKAMPERVDAIRKWCKSHARPSSSSVEHLKEEEERIGFAASASGRKLDLEEDSSTSKGTR